MPLHLKVFSEEEFDSTLRSALSLGSQWNGSPEEVWKKVKNRLKQSKSRHLRFSLVALSFVLVLTVGIGSYLGLTQFKAAPEEMVIPSEDSTNLTQSTLSSVQEPPVFFQPATSEGCPKLPQGSLEEAQQALGLNFLMPSYLPPGAIMEEEGQVFWSQDTIFVSYLVGDLGFSLSQRKATSEAFEHERLSYMEQGAESWECGGHQGFVQETHPETGDNVSKGWVLIRFFADGYVFSVEGDLPLKDELLKVAESLVSS